MLVILHFQSQKFGGWYVEFDEALDFWAGSLSGPNKTDVLSSERWDTDK